MEQAFVVLGTAGALLSLILIVKSEPWRWGLKLELSLRSVQTSKSAWL